MNDNFAHILRMVIIAVSLCSSVITSNLVGYWLTEYLALSEYWSVAFGFVLIIAGEVFENQQNRRPSRVLRFCSLFGKFHGVGILLINYLMFLKGLELRGHQTMANYLAIALPIIAYSLIQSCLYCIHKCLCCIQEKKACSQEQEQG